MGLDEFDRLLAASDRRCRLRPVMGSAPEVRTFPPVELAGDNEQREAGQRLATWIAAVAAGLPPDSREAVEAALAEGRVVVLERARRSR